MKEATDTVEYPNPICPAHEGHHYLRIAWGIWQCKYCLAVKWGPTHWTEALALTLRIRKLGMERAYQEALNERPKVKRALVQLDLIRQSRRFLSTRHFVKVIKKMSVDKMLEDL